ncbi:MAG TPA: hypothetical protein VMR95_03920 [Candidatus Binatia bacterium]|nr:hypothetical protein [Candidatus Binatia bacterium]
MKSKTNWYKSVNARIYRRCFGVVVIWRLLLEVLNQLQAHLYKQANTINSHSLGYLSRWAHWDGSWYLGIVENGYKFLLYHSGSSANQNSIVFFPAFPFTTRYVADITRLNPILAGLIINFLMTSVACFFMYKITILVAEKYGGKLKIDQKYLGTIGMLCLLLYPAALFLAAFYVEAFLMVGITGSIYFALKNRLWWAAAFMMIATASKSSGLVLLPTDAVIVFENWRLAKHRSYPELAKKLSVLVAGLAGLAAFMLYQLIRFGSALLWYRDQAAWRPPTKTFFLNNIYQIYYSHFFQESYYGGRYYYAMNIFLMLLPFLIMALGIWIVVKYKTYWPLVLGFFGLALPLVTGTLLSLNRIEIVTIPMASFIVLASTKKKAYKIALISILLISSLILALLTLGFLRLKFAG